VISSFEFLVLSFELRPSPLYFGDWWQVTMRERRPELKTHNSTLKTGPAMCLEGRIADGR
jgi:hypothetical protein